MKAVKLTAVALSLVSTAAMANVVTNTAGGIMDGGKTLFKTFTNPAAVSAEIGTLGYGANVAWSATPTTEIQAGWAGTGGQVSANGNIGSKSKAAIDVLNKSPIDNINYDVKAKMSNPYLGVQLRPASNWLTVGTGVIVPDNKINLTAKASGGKYTFNGNEYTLDEVGTVTGKFKHKNTLAPYLTVGLRPNSNKRWGVFGEVGAAYVGGVDVDLVSTNGNNANAAIANKAKEAVKDAELELNRKIKKNEQYLNWYPIIKVGATVRF